MDTQSQKQQLLDILKTFDEQMTDEVIEKASKEELLKYIELTEKIKARIEIL